MCCLFPRLGAKRLKQLARVCVGHAPCKVQRRAACVSPALKRGVDVRPMCDEPLDCLINVWECKTVGPAEKEGVERGHAPTSSAQ